MTDISNQAADAFFRGRLNIIQPENGFRAGMDSVILAASIPAQAGEAVLELGIGPGVAALCLAHRTRADITGVEIDTETLAILRHNIELNAMQANIRGIYADATQPKTIHKRGFDHVMMNPPFYSDRHHQPSPHTQKAAAMNSADYVLGTWVTTAITCLKPAGSFTAIIPPARLQVILSAAGSKLGAIQILPVFTRPEQPATRVLVHGRKGRKTPLAILPPFLTMHDGSAMSDSMRALAENGAALDVF